MKRISKVLSLIVSAATSLVVAACSKTEPAPATPTPSVDATDSKELKSEPVKQDPVSDEIKDLQNNEDDPTECVYGPPEWFGMENEENNEVNPDENVAPDNSDKPQDN